MSLYVDRNGEFPWTTFFDFRCFDGDRGQELGRVAIDVTDVYPRPIQGHVHLMGIWVMRVVRPTDNLDRVPRGEMELGDVVVPADEPRL